MAEQSSKPAMGDDAIKRGSGKTWPEWREILDTWGAADVPHDEIARYVHKELGVGEWWAQSVTVGYERMIGRRTIGERIDGSFDTSASKTFPVPITTLFPAWVDEDRRDQWLAPGTLTLRTSVDNTSARFDDNEYGGIVALYFAEKSSEKSSVNIQILKLPTSDAMAERKATWKARLADLVAYLKT